MLLLALLAPAGRRETHTGAMTALPPIFMYHRIDVDHPATAVGRDLTLPPAAFAAELQYLRGHGLRGVSLAVVLRRLREGRSLKRLVVLTFDDGYADQYRYAVPLLRRFGDTATFFIVTGNVGIPNHVTWRDLHAMVAAGMEIGAHGLQHDDLSLMTYADQAAQIFGSTDTLRDRLGVPILSYAYPSGRLNRATLALVRKAGLAFAVTTDLRYVLAPPNRFELTRIRVHGDWGTADFAAALRAARAYPQHW